MAEGVTYKQIRQTGPEYNSPLWCKLDLLYEGGYKILEHAKDFIPQAVGEHSERYEWRVKNASYIGYFSQLIDYLVGALFTSELHIAPAGDDADKGSVGDVPDKKFYTTFSSDADTKGSTFASLMRHAVTHALVYRRVLFGVDMPKAGEPLPENANRADEDDAGLRRAYCYEIPLLQLINWELDERGRFKWAILHKRIDKRESPLDPPGKYIERFKVWTMAPQSDGKQKAVYDVYETKVYDAQKPPQEKDPVILKETGVTEFSKIPLVTMELPKGMWAGNKVGPLAEEHYRRRSELVGSMARSLLEIPVLKLGPEIGGVGQSMPSQAQQNPNRGEEPAQAFARRGYMTIGKDDSLTWEGPSGVAYELTDAQLSSLRDEMFRTVHSMAQSVDNSASALGRSGESKREDREATGVVLGYLGAELRKFAVQLYKFITEVRGEENVVWTGHGLDKYDIGDTDSLVTEAGEVETLDIPSRTFKKEYVTRVAMRLLQNVAPETKAKVQQEIKDGIDEAEDQSELLRDTMSKAGGAGEGGGGGQGGEMLTYEGKTQTVEQWSAELGIPERTIKSRIEKGLSPARALSKKTEK